MTERKMKQTSGVPRGLLQFLVLKLLENKAMSGVEIVEIIEGETRGFWKPSPGSIYPILARLQDKGYTIESSTGDGGMKKYILTSEGKRFFEKQVQLGRNFLTKLEYLVPILLEGIHLNTNLKHMREAGDAAKRLTQVFIDARTTMRDNLTQQDTEEIADILNDCAEQLENITRRIKETHSVVR
jgi:DNA-binding PadR family transcriptional regulator